MSAKQTIWVKNRKIVEQEEAEKSIEVDSSKKWKIGRMVHCEETDLQCMSGGFGEGMGCESAGTELRWLIAESLSGTMQAAGSSPRSMGNQAWICESCVEYAEKEELCES